VIVLDAVTGAAGRVREIATRPQVWVALGALVAAGGLLALIFALVGVGGGPPPLGIGDRPATDTAADPRVPPGAGPAEPGPTADPSGGPAPPGPAGPGSTADPSAPPGAPGGPAPAGPGPVYYAAPTPQPADPPDEAAPPPAPPAPPAWVPLTARYAAAETEGLLGYHATVTITNPGRASHSGWTLVIRLPATALAVTEVSGAEVSRSGATWTFTPTPDTRTVPAGESVRVRYAVRDAPLLSGAPLSCTVDGTPCAGLD
jgi:hypothetical protein